MPIPINPYIAGDPVGNGPAFVGRDDVLRDVLKVLRSPSQNAITLFGQRRIGKTSMLQNLKKRLPDEGPYLSVYFDLQDKAAWPLPRLLAELARAIAADLGWPTPTLSMADTEPFRIWIKQRLDGFDDGQALALLFDEFDVLADPQTGSAAKEFFPYLRDLLSLNPARLQFVFVLGRNINDLSSLALSVFKGVESKRVSLLTRADTAKLVRLSEQNETLFWSEKAIETVYDLTRGHAYLTQALCSQVWEAAYDEEPDSAPKVTPQMVTDAIEATLDSSRNMLEWLWNGLGPAEKVVSAALAGAGSVVVDEARLEHILRESGVRILIRELQNAPQMLVDWDILEAVDGGHIFRVELLRRWLAKYHPLSRTQAELDRILPAADNLFQAADAFYTQGELKRAEDLLEQAVGINPNHLRANEMLAEILIGGGRLAEAREKLEKLLEFAPSVARPRLVQVYLQQAQAAADDAARLVLYEKTLGLDSGNPEARAGAEKIRQFEREEKELAFNYIEGRQALQRGEWQRAVEFLQKAVARQPSYTYERGKDAESAADLLARAVREDRQRPPAWRIWPRNNLALAGLSGTFVILLLVFSASFGSTVFQAAVDSRSGWFGTLTPTFTTAFTPAETLTPSYIPPTSILTPTATNTLQRTSTNIPTNTLTAGETSALREADGMVMVYVPAVIDYFMSSNYKVTLDSFWMDEHEVTNAMYKLCVDVGSCQPPSTTNYYNNNPNSPVVYVNWDKANAYCKWAGSRLPTEAEWEYAARGGLQGQIYPWGDEAPVCTPGSKNGAQYSYCDSRGFIDIKIFQPNGYGLYDMAGNVWEWVSDWHDISYPSGSFENPTGPESGPGKVLRGGSWYSFYYNLRVSHRFGVTKAATDNDVGFRCIRSIPEGGLP